MNNELNSTPTHCRLVVVFMFLLFCLYLTERDIFLSPHSSALGCADDHQTLYKIKKYVSQL